MKIFLGISGASGVNLGLKLAREIAKRAQLHLCVSKNAMNVLEKELNFTNFFCKNGVNLNLIGGFGGKFDEAANRSGILKFNVSQDAGKFGKIYGDADDMGADFQNLAPNLTRSCGSQTRRDESAKFVNLSSVQDEPDFSDGSKNSQDKSGELISGGAQISGGENLKDSEMIGGTDVGDRALDGANGQFRQNRDKFDFDENKMQDAQIYGKFGNQKFQNQSDFDRISTCNGAEYLNKFDAYSNDENKAKNLAEFDAIKSQNQDNFDKTPIHNDIVCNKIYQDESKFDRNLGSEKTKWQNSQILNEFYESIAAKSQNKKDFDKISAKKKGEFLNKFDACSEEKNLSEFDSEKYQNQSEFDKNSACSNAEYLNKFDACSSDKNKAVNSSKFDAIKSQNKVYFDKNSTQNSPKQDEIYQIWQDLQNIAAIHDDSDLAAPPSSGSFGIDATIIAPCSINTLAKIHAGLADTLITRAAAVALKERKRLVLGVREMPFSTISLEHAVKLSSLGALIAPPVLGYYSGQDSLEDMENFIIGKWLDLLGLENQIYKRWS